MPDDPLDDVIEMAKASPTKARPATPIVARGSARWVYKMVPIPYENYVGEKATLAKHVNAAAKYLEDTVNLHCIDGWEFVRTETISTISSHTPGFLASLLGSETEFTTLVHYILVFRQEK